MKSLAMALPDAFVSGIVLTAGLIIGLGPQNVFILRQGLRKRFIGVIILTCIVSEITLVSVGALGIGNVLLTQSSWKTFIGAAGVAFLAGYGTVSFYMALKSVAGKDLSPKSAGPQSLHTAVSMAAAFAFLNPWALLDTVLIIGGYAAQFEHIEQTLVFVAGSWLLSSLWFAGLGYGAGFLKKWFEKPLATRVIDFLAGAIMWAIAVKLADKIW
ncbi:MAG: LysE family transporter [Alphaproteobacteria bacterium]|nr:LysE family transporter [Alphaproteobacteria bacterium]